MSDSKAPEGSAASAASDAQAGEQAIRERVRELASQMLASGRLDTDGVKDVVRTISGGGAPRPLIEGALAREAFAESMRSLDSALHASALATHAALQALVEHGKDFSDNDLKNAFAALQNLQKDFVAVADRIAEATSGNLRRELGDLALHAQRVGADVNVRFAQLLTEFANRLGAVRAGSAPAFDSVRQYGANMTMLTSGLLAGLSDALRQQSEGSKAK